MNKPLVIYHAGCYDGFTAAWVVWKALKGQCDLTPAQYGAGDPPDLSDRKAVYIVDFSYPRETLIQMKDQVDYLTVLDHHKTAEENLEGLDFCEFDMNRSGATMAWDHFFDPENRPLLVEYVQDRDLWLWDVPHSKPINDWIQSFDFDLNTWEFMCEWLEHDFQAVLREAQAIQRFKKRQVGAICDGARSIHICGHKVPAVNSCIFQSDVGHTLCQGHPFAAIWFKKEDQYIWSLRSTDNGEDVRKIAEAMGGGGHRNAAGFRTNYWSKDIKPTEEKE